MAGICDSLIDATPIAVVDFETTGLTAGADRVVEASVVRIDPGQRPRLVFDSLIQPLRRVAATEIHGITDDDVRDAPTFGEVADEFRGAISGCVVASYNVYFDIGFLEFELSNAGGSARLPHFCVMYMRPLLGVGKKCPLRTACVEHQVEHSGDHIAAVDAYASAMLLELLLGEARKQSIRTFSDLRCRSKYKFLNSFDLSPLAVDLRNIRLAGRKKSRVASSDSRPLHRTQVGAPPNPVALYWDALVTALSDYEVTHAEAVALASMQRQFGLRTEQLRMLHARVFAHAIQQFTGDAWLNDAEVRALQQLRNCLEQLGWAP